jgi:hypothetical protein
MRDIVTKSSYGRMQRCQQCRKPFIPKAGGRPAKFCSASCRQRAYEARKAPFTSPAAQRRTPALTAGSTKEQFFEQADVEAIILKTGAKPLDGTDFGAAADKLNDIVDGYISTACREAAPTAGETENWLQSIERNVEKVLAHFDVAGPRDHLNSLSTINALHTLDRLLPTNDRREIYLRQRIAREVGVSRHSRQELRQQAAVRLALQGQQYLLHIARLAAAVVERDKGAARRKPREELNLVAQVRNLYVEMTGDRKRYTNDPVNDTQGSVLVKVIAAVAKHIDDHLALVEPPVPTGLRKKLTALCGTPRRIIERLRELGKLSQVQNRPQFT